jgi:hypothetical protein
VNDPRRPSAPADAPGSGVPDDEFARAFSEGYGEGLREALREMLQHASRGHTASELRLLIESRLARVREDVELKRKSVLSPPRRPSWGAILRPPAPSPSASPPPGRPEVPTAAPGDSFLFREERPARALALAGASAARYPLIVVASLRPQALPGIPSDRLTFLQIATGNVSGAISDPGRLAGELRTALEAEGSALVYFDAFETLSTEAGIDTMLKFVTWLTSEATATGGVVVVSIDPGSLDGTVLGRLQRSFKFVP